MFARNLSSEFSGTRVCTEGTKFSSGAKLISGLIGDINFFIIISNSTFKLIFPSH